MEPLCLSSIEEWTSSGMVLSTSIWFGTKKMRILSIILAFCGSVWAFVALVGWIVIIPNVHIQTGLDIARFLLHIVILVSGYFVWWGWVFYSFKERYPLLGQQTFWSICLAHHLLFVVSLIPVDVWGGGDDPWWIPVWIVGNILIAITVLVRRPWN